MPALPQHESRKDSDRQGRRLREGNVAVCPTDDEAVVPRKVDKQSLDYLWRSGTAGGLAGCAVSTMGSCGVVLWEMAGLVANLLVNRQKPSSRRLTGSKSSSRQGIHSSSSTRGPGLVQLLL